MYNLMSLDEFTASCPGLHWREFLAGGESTSRQWVSWWRCSHRFLTEVSALLTEDRLPAWRAWAKWQVINSLSPYLSSAFVDENFRFYGTVLWVRPSFASAGSGGRAGRGRARRGGRQDLRRAEHFSPAAKDGWTSWSPT